MNVAGIIDDDDLDGTSTAKSSTPVPCDTGDDPIRVWYRTQYSIHPGDSRFPVQTKESHRLLGWLRSCTDCGVVKFLSLLLHPRNRIPGF
jgi:hypothetical protein